METFGNQILPKFCPKYYCKLCDYATSKKSSYNTHILARKHIKRIMETENELNGNQILPKFCSSFFTCEKCCKEFKNYIIIYYKNKTCNILNSRNKLPIFFFAYFFPNSILFDSFFAIFQHRKILQIVSFA
jgi:hypothetical protein